jgi:hypothetical protein
MYFWIEHDVSILQTKPRWTSTMENQCGKADYSLLNNPAGATVSEVNG